MENKEQQNDNTPIIKKQTRQPKTKKTEVVPQQETKEKQTPISIIEDEKGAEQNVSEVELSEIENLKASRKKIKTTIEILRLEVESFVNDRLRQIMVHKAEAKALKKQIKLMEKTDKVEKTDKKTKSAE